MNGVIFSVCFFVSVSKTFHAKENRNTKLIRKSKFNLKADLEVSR